MFTAAKFGSCVGQTKKNIYDRHNCSKYYYCDENSEQLEQECPAGQVFDIEAGVKKPCVDVLKCAVKTKIPKPPRLPSESNPLQC